MTNTRNACRLFACLLLTLALVACGGGSPERGGKIGSTEGHYKLGRPYQIAGRWYYPEFDPAYEETGVASWYGSAFHGRPTANGEVFDKDTLSAAHPTLPLPSLVEVTNLENGRTMTIRVNDRGPFVDDRLIDLSEAAARKLGFHDRGLARVKVKFIGLADATGTPPSPTRVAKTTPPARFVPAPAAEVRVASLDPPPAPAPAPRKAAARASSACSAPQHVVQVAAFSDDEQARRLAGRLSAVGPAFIEQVEGSGGRRLARVRVGPFSGRRSAFDLLAELHRLGYRDAVVMGC